MQRVFDRLSFLKHHFMAAHKLTEEVASALLVGGFPSDDFDPAELGPVDMDGIMELA